MVVFPLTPLFMVVLRVLNVVLSQLFPNRWGYIRAFEMIYENLDVTSMVKVFFSLYTTKPTKGRWVSLSTQLGKALFASHSNHYKYWKDKFIHVSG